MSSHLSLWKKVCEVPEAYTKPVSLGRRKFTSVDAQYVVMRATEAFGPMGLGWGLRNIRHEFIEDEGRTTVVMSGDMFYRLNGEEGVIPVYADMPFSHRDDVFKKLQTQLQSKGLSKLGFCADVYMGRFEDDMYMQAARERDALARLADRAIHKLGGCRTLAEIHEVKDKAGDYFGEGKLTAEGFSAVIDAADERAKLLAKLPGAAASKKS